MTTGDSPPCSRHVPWTGHFLTSPTPIPQLDGDLNLLSEPECAPVADYLLGSSATCADKLASEPDELEQVFGTEFCDNLSCRVPDDALYAYYPCVELKKRAVFKNIRECKTLSSSSPFQIKRLFCLLNIEIFLRIFIFLSSYFRFDFEITGEKFIY